MQPLISLRFPETYGIRYFRTKLVFDFPTSIFNHFNNKSYLRSEKYITNQFYTL